MFKSTNWIETKHPRGRNEFNNWLSRIFVLRKVIVTSNLHSHLIYCYHCYHFSIFLGAMLFPVVLQAWVSCLFFRDICLPVFDVYGGQKHCLTFLLLQFWKVSKSTMSRRRFTQELVVCWYVGGMLWELCLIQCRYSSWFIMLGVQKCWCLCLPMVKGKSIFFKRHLFWNKTHRITTFPCSLRPRKALSAGAQFENFDRCDSWWFLQDLPICFQR